MNKTEMKLAARELIMVHLSTICYGSEYEEYIAMYNGDQDGTGEDVLFKEMDRVAHLLGYKHAWIY